MFLKIAQHHRSFSDLSDCSISPLANVPARNHASGQIKAYGFILDGCRFDASPRSRSSPGSLAEINSEGRHICPRPERHPPSWKRGVGSTRPPTDGLSARVRIETCDARETP